MRLHIISCSSSWAQVLLCCLPVMVESADARGVRKRHVQLLCRVARELLSAKTAGPAFTVPRDDAKGQKVTEIMVSVRACTAEPALKARAETAFLAYETTFAHPVHG